MYCDFVAFVKRCLLVPPRFSLKAAAASYDSIRVYHQQLSQWKDEDEQIPAEERGWRLHDGKLVPIMTHLQPCLGGHRFESVFVVRSHMLIISFSPGPYDCDGLLIFT